MAVLGQSFVLADLAVRSKIGVGLNVKYIRWM